MSATTEKIQYLKERLAFLRKSQTEINAAIAAYETVIGAETGSALFLSKWHNNGSISAPEVVTLPPAKEIGTVEIEAEPAMAMAVDVSGDCYPCCLNGAYAKEMATVVKILRHRPSMPKDILAAVFESHPAKPEKATRFRSYLSQALNAWKKRSFVRNDGNGWYLTPSGKRVLKVKEA